MASRKRHQWWLAMPGGFVVACGLATASAAAGPPGTVYSTTYLRVGPGYQYAAVDELDPHSRVEVQSCEKDWCRIRSGTVSGFIRADVLSAPDTHSKPPPPPGGAACFAADLNGRPRGGEEVRVCDSK